MAKIIDCRRCQKRANNPEIIVEYKSSDENYILDLCDLILNDRACRQHRFDFLRGDPGNKAGCRGTMLPVDGYYPKKKLVIEYHERQHSERVPIFDDKPTVSGISRGEQRRKYDERRCQILPLEGIDLVTFRFDDFTLRLNKRLKRIEADDEKIVHKSLEKFIKASF